MSKLDVLLLSTDGDPLQLASLLNKGNLAVQAGSTLEQIKRELLTRRYEVLVNRSANLNELQLDVLHFIRRYNLSTRVIFSSTQGTVEDAVKLMKAGASDFILHKDTDNELADLITRSVLQAEHLPLDARHVQTVTDRPAAAAASTTRGEAAPAVPSDGARDLVLIGQNPSMREMRFAINLVAKSETAVLITGESGTGKEVVARMIHQLSSRSDKPFVPLNCAAFPKDVIENELFGHEKGAFTGALIKKKGYFEMADTGTLFFDELAEMHIETQAKLLRAIETKTFRRLGGKEEIHVDVRAIAATNKNIAQALRKGEFREDLYYRFSVIEINIPPLRERRDDIPLLLDHFLSVFSQKHNKPRKEFAPDCLQVLLDYDWPGNVRELQNSVERCMVICPSEIITEQYLPERMRKRKEIVVAPKSGQISIMLGSSTLEAEKTLILQTLASVGNNKSKAAKILGVSRKTLHNKLRVFAQQEGRKDEAGILESSTRSETGETESDQPTTEEVSLTRGSMNLDS